jgi:ABC-type glycerol-3-phosphate transport system substrate-binding protein
MWTDLVSKYKVQPQDDITRDGDACNLLFTSGQAASIWLAGQGYKDIVTKASWDAKTQFKFTIWPSFDGTKPSPINAGAWTMGVSSKAKNKDLAWAWLEHYLSAESDAIMARVGGVLPSRLSTLKDPIFSTPDFQFLHDYLDVAAQGTFDPSRSRAKVTPATELANAFQDVIANGTSVDDAMKAAADRFNRAEMA